MRGNQEAFILVKVKDGSKYVCAINTSKSSNKNGHNAHNAHNEQNGTTIDLERDVIWH
ncbi:MAG: hypothetical protein ABR512_12320 [Desulfopila sp.]